MRFEENHEENPLITIRPHNISIRVIRKTHSIRNSRSDGSGKQPGGFPRKVAKTLGSAALPLPKAHLDPMSRTNHNLALDLLLPLPPTHVDPFEPLQNPRDRVAFPARTTPPLASNQAPLTRRKARLTHLSQSELLPNADPWASVERYIVPALRRPILPAFRTVGLYIRGLGGGSRVQVRAALHVKG